MRLYYYPPTASLAPHIVAEEAGVELELAKVDLTARKTERGAQTESGEDFGVINRKGGYVPALRLDDGNVLTETPTVMEFLANQRADAGLLPPYDSLDYYRVHEWMAFIASELHKVYTLCFWESFPALEDELRAHVAKRFAYIDEHLRDREFLVGEHLTVADIYLFVMFNGANYLKMDLERYPNVNVYRQRLAARPAVQAAMEAHGLQQPAWT